VALTVEQLWQPVPGGSGTYVREIAGALSTTDEIELSGIAARHAAPPADGPLPVPVRHSRLPRRVLYDAWQRAGRPTAEALVPGADVVHATTWAIPATRRPLVVTVHDVAFLDDPDHFTARGNAFFRRALERTRDDADAVIVPSHATADAAVAAGLDPRRITVVPHGVRVPSVDDVHVARWRRAADVRNDYVLWCGTVEPRKNVASLLHAFVRVAEARADIDLVLAGPTGWGPQLAVPAGLDARRVHITGRLSATDLAAAYRGARAFCFPSIREGFGLPVLEAMAHGVPVVTSAGTACAEVAGDAALLVRATDPDEIAAALLSAIGPAHDDLVTAGTERAGAFTWEAAAAATLEVYSAVAV
jgi:glycosyltransferase involved in cell wall biosynthesis